MPAKRSTRSDSGIRIASIALLTAILLAGCTGISSPSPSPSQDEASPTVAPGEEVTPTAAPEYRPDGTAGENLQYFTAVIAAFQATNGRGKDSAEVVSALTDAGFPREAIEVTDSTTPNGYAAVSIETAVKIGGDCLLATLRAERYTVELAPVLPTGRCLIDG